MKAVLKFSPARIALFGRVPRSPKNRALLGHRAVPRCCPVSSHARPSGGNLGGSRRCPRSESFSIGRIVHWIRPGRSVPGRWRLGSGCPVASRPLSSEPQVRYRYLRWPPLASNLAEKLGKRKYSHQFVPLEFEMNLGEERRSMMHSRLRVGALVLAGAALAFPVPAWTQAQSLDAQIEPVRVKYGLPALAAAVG